MNKRKIGQIGESIAEKILTSQGYRIIKKNYFCRYGEIDLIALSPDQFLIFVEVKLRQSLSFGSAQESITLLKQKRMITTALTYLQTVDYPVQKWRFDGIFIKVCTNGKIQDIKHLKNIFDGS